MPADRPQIIEYDFSLRPDLLRLLQELQTDYLKTHISRQIQDLQKEKDPRRAYESYLDFIENNAGTWIVFLAQTKTGELIGFIIGSVETDDQLVLTPIGKVEDWFVEEEFRGMGIGALLYEKLESWFIENGCKQVRSDTWHGNQLSIEVHKRLGFFVSGVQFGKKL